MDCEEGKGSHPMHKWLAEKFSNEHMEEKGHDVARRAGAQASDAVGNVSKAENANNKKLGSEQEDGRWRDDSTTGSPQEGVTLVFPQRLTISQSKQVNIWLDKT